MELKARTVVEGFLSGLHRSPYKGFSVEFAEYRQYCPATICPRSTGRSTRDPIAITSRSSRKRRTSNATSCSTSADRWRYRGGAAMSKLEYGSVLAGSLAYLMNRQRDATGLIAFDEQIVARLPASARAGHLHAILLALEKIAPGYPIRCRPPSASARRGAREAQPGGADLRPARRARHRRARTEASALQGHGRRGAPGPRPLRAAVSLSGARRALPTSRVRRK